MKRLLRNSSLALVAMLTASSYAFAEGALDAPMPIEIHGWFFSHDTIVMCGVVAFVITALCWLGSRGLSKEKPGKAQVLLEMIVTAFDDLVKQSIGPTRGRKYLPYIGTLFLFVWTCNMIGMVPIEHSYIGAEPYHDFNHNGSFDPGEWDQPKDDLNKNGMHDPGFRVPAFEEPTANLNVPLGLALLFVLFIGHGSEIRIHGLWGYIKSYFSPEGMIGICMFPLNVVGKIAEIVSISFRLFGNIFGGVVIITVVSGLLSYILVPIGLFGFFGVFVGTVQAFVFTMLALTYISMGAAEE
ncbi:MAG: F0F1 ATP synthase subunit A [Planctomycetes bacterium]|nr:F0F1 ATP synthase subunit A [Planctomycetota bacterium]